MNFKKLFTKSNVVALLILVALAWLHVSLVAKTFVIDDTGAFHTALSGYGDIPLHLTQISKFAFRPFDLNDPIFYGEKLHYPFLINFFSGFLLRITGWWSISVLGPVLLLVVANIILAFLLFRTLIRRPWLAALAVVFFLLGSGLGGWRYVTKVYHENWTLGEFSHWLKENNISTATRWDAKWPEQNIAFGAPMSLVYIHQRPFLLGTFLFLIWCLLVLKTRKHYSWQSLVGAGIVLGIMPLAHTHTFVAASITLASLALVAVWRRDWKIFQYYLGVVGIAAILAIPQMIYLVGTKTLGSGQGSFIDFHAGWMVERTIGSATVPDGQTVSWWRPSYIKFLWMNFGIFLPLFLLSFFIKSTQKKNIQWLFAGLLLFFAVQVVRFQPWDYDNNKLLVYWQFFAVGSILVVLESVLDHHPKWGNLLLGGLLLVGLGSGVIDQIPRFMTSRSELPQIATVEARELASHLASLPDNTLILTGTSHLNPVAMLAGRQMLVGYPGWLWTRGLDYGKRVGAIETFYRDPSRSSDILSKYPITHILLDDQVIYERSFSANSNAFNTLFEKVFVNSRYTLYKL